MGVRLGNLESMGGGDVPIEDYGKKASPGSLFFGGRRGDERKVVEAGRQQGLPSIAQEEQWCAGYIASRHKARSG